ncbi:MAG: helix-turn-helix domain-containing protein [Lachnospiraceae bacterium]
MIGEKIRELRIKSGLTQRDLAEALKVVPQAVSRWEHMEADPSVELLPKLADIFEVTIDELFGRENTKRVKKSDEEVRKIVREEIQNMLDVAKNAYDRSNVF